MYTPQKQDKQEDKMTNINDSSNNFVYYGGVRFLKDDVSSAGFNYSKGKQQYEVKLKTGQILIFEDQTGTHRPGEPSVSALTQKGYAYLYGTNMSDITIFGAPDKKDYIDIEGKNNTIYVNNDNYADEVYTKDSRKKLEEKDSNRAALGEKDIWVDAQGIKTNLNKDTGFEVNIPDYLKK